MIQFDEHIFQMGWLETTHLDSAFDPFDCIPGGVWQSTRMVGYLSLMNAVASCLANQTFPKTLKRDHFQNGKESSQQVPRIFRGYVAVLEGEKCHGWFERLMLFQPIKNGSET